jgi:predicted dehydrogenase
MKKKYNVIRIGIIGAGDNTRQMHIPGFRAIAGVEIVGVCNRSIQSSRKAAKNLKIPRVYENWMDLANDPRIDAVCIGTWPYLHCPATLAALAAGKHVLTEARMAMNAAEAHAMLDASRARPDLVAQIVPAPMTFRVDRTVQRLLADGYVGDVLAVEVRDGGRFIDSTSRLHWRQDADLSGYNIMSMGIWYETILRWVGEATQVTAMGRTFTKTRLDEQGAVRAVRVPEHIDVTATLACGGQLHMQISSVTGFNGPAHATIHGSAGTLRFTENKLLGGKRGDKELSEIPIPTSEIGKWRVESDFIASIREKTPVKLTPFVTGVQYMEFTEAVTRSMQGGNVVAIPM